MDSIKFSKLKEAITIALERYGGKGRGSGWQSQMQFGMADKHRTVDECKTTDECKMADELGTAEQDTGTGTGAKGRGRMWL